MAVHIKIVPVPHTNKDGSASKVKKDLQVWVRSRKGKRELIGTFTTKAGAETCRDGYREDCRNKHLETHPNDTHFRAKHKI